MQLVCDHRGAHKHSGQLSSLCITTVRWKFELIPHPDSNYDNSRFIHTFVCKLSVLLALSLSHWEKKQGFSDGISNDALTTWSYILPADAIVRLQGNIIHQKSADNDLRCQMCRWFLTLLRPPCLPLITKRNFFQPPTRLFCCLNVS